MPVDRLRTRTCPTCRGGFSYPIGKGADRKHCSAACRVAHQKARRSARLTTMPQCSTPGCEGRATRIAAGQCEACYCRVRRTGTVDKTQPTYRYLTTAGYVVVVRPDHPLADAEGRVFEHRLVAFEAHTGPISCFWCERGLEWSGVCVDHLNETKNDNRLENLAISCNDCNRARGAMLPFIRRLKPGMIRTLMDWMLLYRAVQHDDPGVDYRCATHHSRKTAETVNA
jgi:hypothetical protein